MNQPVPPIILSFGSRARIGKDHACRVIQSRYPDAVRIAFADQLKTNLRSLLGPLGLDPFTTDPVVKEQIRPVLVAYGMLARKVDPDFWVRQVFQYIDRRLQQPEPPRLFLLPDARFANEVQAVQHRGGYYVEIATDLPFYANEEERTNSPLCARLADFTLTNHYSPAFPHLTDPEFDQQILGLVEKLFSK